MNTFAWDSSYEVGHARIDHEHQGLVELINRVLALQDAPDAAEHLPGILARLLRYAGEHFAAEEALMAEHGVDERHAASHREAHRTFADEVQRIQHLPVAAQQVRRIGEFLQGWLVGHILNHDKALMRELERDATTADRLLQDIVRDQRTALALLTQIVEGSPVAAFVLDRAQRVSHWNRACVQLSQVPAHEVVGTDQAWRGFYPAARPALANLLMSNDIDRQLQRFYPDAHRYSPLIPGAVEAEVHFPHMGPNGRWLLCIAAPLHDEQGQLIGAVETLQDVTERRLARQALLDSQARLEQEVAARTQELLRRNEELTLANDKLVRMRQQLVQAEKLASIGQLAAGVAHEINNPIGYVHSNLGSLDKYLADLFRLLDAYEAAELAMANTAEAERLRHLRDAVELRYLRDDVPELMRECQEGISRVRKIVQDLKDFSRVDNRDQFEPADLHHGLDSTLTIVNNEIKYKADVVKRYGQLPPIDCLASQLNQVFMNLLVNAAQAMGDQRGTITVTTGVEGDSVWVEIADTGCGIPADKIDRIFDPFYTTKPVGKGTGLGLSLSYGIVQNHGGSLTVCSEPGVGTTFRIRLPIHQPAATPTAPA